MEEFYIHRELEKTIIEAAKYFSVITGFIYYIKEGE